MQNITNYEPSKPGVILLADDEPLVREFISAVLRAEGYTMLMACDGESALEISRGFSGRIDAVLSDIDMPRINGIQLREAILTERPGIRVMLMSGKVSFSDETVPFLQKPFQTADLKKQMRQLLDASPSRPCQAALPQAADDRLRQSEASVSHRSAAASRQQGTT